MFISDRDSSLRRFVRVTAFTFNRDLSDVDPCHLHEEEPLEDGGIPRLPHLLRLPRIGEFTERALRGLLRVLPLHRE